MPSFQEYIEDEVEIDIDPQEYIDACSPRELQVLRELLLSEENSNSHGYPRWEYDMAITKLSGKYASLTKEESDLIVKLAARF